MYIQNFASESGLYCEQFVSARLHVNASSLAEPRHAYLALGSTLLMQGRANAAMVFLVFLGTNPMQTRFISSLDASTNRFD